MSRIARQNGNTRARVRAHIDRLNRYNTVLKPGRAPIQNDVCVRACRKSNNGVPSDAADAAVIVECAGFAPPGDCSAISNFRGCTACLCVCVCVGVCAFIVNKVGACSPHRARFMR